MTLSSVLDRTRAVVRYSGRASGLDGAPLLFVLLDEGDKPVARVPAHSTSCVWDDSTGMAVAIERITGHYVLAVRGGEDVEDDLLGVPTFTQADIDALDEART